MQSSRLNISPKKILCKTYLILFWQRLLIQLFSSFFTPPLFSLAREPSLTASSARLLFCPSLLPLLFLPSFSSSSSAPLVVGAVVYTNVVLSPLSPSFPPISPSLSQALVPPPPLVSQYIYGQLAKCFFLSLTLSPLSCSFSLSLSPSLVHSERVEGERLFVVFSEN